MGQKSIIFMIALLMVKNISTIERCQRDCQNFITLKTENVEIRSQKKNITLEIEKYPETIKIDVLTRRIWKHITTGNGAQTTVKKENGPVIPDFHEAKEWLMRGMCKIGSLCYPSGDCYGDGLRHCEGMGLNPSWVENREMSFEGSIWGESMIFLRTRCVQDWSCNLEEKESILYIDEDMRPYINPGNQKILINDNEYTKTKSYAVMVKEKCTPIKKIVLSECIQDGSKKLCSFYDELKRHSVEFKETEKCKSIRNIVVCLKRFNKRSAQNDAIATIDDTKIVSEEINSVISTQNYNNFLLQQEIFSLKETINKIILSSSRFNPFIIKDITGLNVYVQKRGKFMTSCPCKHLDDDCELNKVVHEGDSNCYSHKKAKVVDVVKMESLSHILPDDLEFRGKEESIYETETEREFGNKESFINPSISEGNNDFFKGLTYAPGFDIFTCVVYILPFINFFLIMLRR